MIRCSPDVQLLLCASHPQDKDTELYAANVKVQQLEEELQDLSSQESKDEASLAKLKKQLHDLEAKVKDQEEELDEQAGSIQMLEQVRASIVLRFTFKNFTFPKHETIPKINSC